MIAIRVLIALGAEQLVEAAIRRLTEWIHKRRVRPAFIAWERMENLPSAFDPLQALAQWLKLRM